MKPEKTKYKGYVHIVHYKTDVFWIISRIGQPKFSVLVSELNKTQKALQ